MPVPVSVTLAESAVSPQKTRALTDGGEVHQGREGGSPVVGGINDGATVQLEGRPTLDTCATNCEAGLTRNPSASHWFKGFTM